MRSAGWAVGRAVLGRHGAVGCHKVLPGTWQWCHGRRSLSWTPLLCPTVGKNGTYVEAFSIMAAESG